MSSRKEKKRISTKDVIDMNVYMSMAQMNTTVKVVIVGDRPADLLAPVDAFFYTGEKKVVLNLINTAGCLDKSQREAQYVSANVFLVLFNIVDNSSFSNVISTYLPEVLNFAPHTPVVLGGLNVEQRHNVETLAALHNKLQFPIPYAKGEALANAINAHGYFECSLESRKGNFELFEAAVVAATTEKRKKTSKDALEMLRQIVSAGEHGDIMKATEKLEQLASLHNHDQKFDIQYFHLLLQIAFHQKQIPKKIKEHFDRNFLSTAVLSKNPPDMCGRDLKQIPEGLLAKVHWESLNLSQNLLEFFPACSHVKHLDLSYNNLKEVPEGILVRIPKLETLDISYNFIDTLPAALAHLKDLKAVGNPLSGILPAFRTSNEKISFYLRLLVQGPVQWWNRIKLMLVGQEAVGKTTLLHALQNEKYDTSENVSTNGVQISSITLSAPSSSLLSRLKTHSRQNSNSNSVSFDIWDFGGQTVFHSTHRFFLTAHALYLVVYDMSKPETCERLRYWIDQIGSISDQSGTKPIIIVGTHSDLLSKSERNKWVAEMEKLFPTPVNPLQNRNQVQVC